MAVKIFVDANVIISVLNREYPLFTNSARILSLADNARYRVFTSPMCLAIAYYFVEKKNGTESELKRIALLSSKLSITTVSEKTVRTTTTNPAVHDFEDGLEYYSAIYSGCKIIVTEDVSNFYFSQVPVYDCETFIRVEFMKKK